MDAAVSQTVIATFSQQKARQTARPFFFANPQQTLTKRARTHHEIITTAHYHESISKCFSGGTQR
jgi:hypothetical protein